MDTTIGEKGGHNDLKRTMIITKRQKEKLKKHQEQKKLQELEKEVKKKQIKTFVKIAPVIIAGNVFKTLSGNNHIETLNPLFLPTSSTENYEKQSFLTTDSHNNIIEVTIKNPTLFEEKVKANPESIKKLTTLTEQINTKKKQVEVLEVSQDNIPIKKEKIETNIDKLKNKEIISQYEEKLIQARRELKEIVFEYQVIADNYKDVYNSEELQELLDKLNVIVKKLNELKEKIRLEDTNDYDETYIRELASSYISSFDKKEIISEIRDSELYILISSKIAELEIQKELLNIKLEDKKADLKLDEDNIDILKEKYNEYDSFNLALLKLQAEQDLIVKELQQKIASSVSIKEKVEVQTKFLNIQAKQLMGLLGVQSLIPGPRSARKMAIATASYLYFTRNMTKRLIKPQSVTKHYRVFQVADYSKDIEISLNELDKGIYLIRKTSTELKRTIIDFKESYKDYLDMKNVKDLLDNLEKVYASLKEKEEDLLRIKYEQEKNLEENKEKNKLVKKYERIDWCKVVSISIYFFHISNWDMV